MTTTTLLPDTISPLSRESAAAAFADILDGRAGEDAIAAFLIGLTERGEDLGTRERLRHLSQ